MVPGQAPPRDQAVDAPISSGDASLPEPRQAPPGPTGPADDSVGLRLIDLGIAGASDAARLGMRLLQTGLRAAEPVVRLTAKIPLVGPGIGPGAGPPGYATLRDYSLRGHAQRIAAERAVRDLVLELVPRVTAALLDQIDINALIRERVDFDAIIAEIDVNKLAQTIDLNEVAAQLDINAVASRLDVEAVLQRVDLAGVARNVIEAIDLPEIVRDSTGTLASETVRSVRFRTVEADDRVSRAVARLLRRGIDGEGRP